MIQTYTLKLITTTNSNSKFLLYFFGLEMLINKRVLTSILRKILNLTMLTC